MFVSKKDEQTRPPLLCVLLLWCKDPAQYLAFYHRRRVLDEAFLAGFGRFVSVRLLAVGLVLL